MKGLITIIVIIILLGLGWVFFQSQGGDTVENGDDAAMEENGGAMMEGENGDATAEDGDAMTEDHDGDAMADTDTKTFDLTGSNYEFSETEIHVKQGDTVTINLTSDEGLHDWMIDEFDAATEQVRPNDGVTSVTFTADEVGEFEYYCSVGNHRELGMVGTLTVEE